MTAGQLQYAQILEDRRSNLAREAETYRHNRATEDNASAQLGLGYRNLSLGRDSLGETMRSNSAREAETYRSNMAREKEATRHNTATERLTQNKNEWDVSSGIFRTIMPFANGMLFGGR